VLSLVCCIGCSGGSEDHPDLGTVTGSIRVDGTGMPGLRVLFQPDSGRRSIGVTDESGNYSLNYTKDVQGARIGKHKVSITWTGESHLEGEDTEVEAADAEAGVDVEVVKIPANYNTETTLTANVKAGSNVVDFDIQK
tara:strand:+ start:202847 stop:203260 length:414 start_codon:yes stop_codon:yes gene_type:complete